MFVGATGDALRTSVRNLPFPHNNKAARPLSMKVFGEKWTSKIAQNVEEITDL